MSQYGEAPADSFKAARLPSISPEIETAYSEARARGLPEGWTCSIDKRNRRKWTAPNNGRSCDSIPKAIAISVELGLLPPDTIIPSGNPKKKRPISSSTSRPRKKLNSEDASADAAEALLSMVTSSHHMRSQNEALTGATGGSASLAPSVTSSSGRDVKKATKVADTMSNDPSDDDDDEAEKGPPPVPMDPETTLDVFVPLPISRSDAALPTTVHWDPSGINGRFVGWRVKISPPGNQTSSWMDGRVIRYDPHTHKHKIQYCLRSQSVLGSGDESYEKSRLKYAWIWLRNEKHNLQIATRMVWAHVKGYAWWPALVMESNQAAMKAKEGYVSIEFFGTGETSHLRDTPESIRPFDPKVLDPIVAKHRKKRNERAFQAAAEEFRTIQATRNAAALYFARAACAMASYYAPKNANLSSTSGPNGPALIGKRVQLFRSDVNYPYGDTVVGKVRQYSFFQKKWLLSFEISEKQSHRAKYPPAWINVYGKDHALKMLDKKTETECCTEDLIPFLYGFEAVDESVYKDGDDEVDECIGKKDFLELKDLLASRCRGCVEYLKSSSSVANVPNAATTKSSTMEQTITCSVCSGSFHLCCCDPPLSLDQWQRIMKDDTEYTCSRCTPCRGCYEKDIAFGCQAHPCPPTMLTPLEGGKDSTANLLCLCSTCRQHYDAERFCPNCAHIWDDKRFRMVTRQIAYANAASKRRKKGSLKDILEDSDMNMTFGVFEGDDVLPFEDKLHPSYFYPEATEWGFTEDEMLVCDNCNVWVHAGCSGMTEKEYEATSNGDHPIFSKEYFCRMCCRKRCKELIEGLLQEDRKSLFALPVSDRIVPNYHDMIKEPMDLQTMLEKVESEEYVNYAWVRELFALMVLNALTFNRIYTDVWREAKRFYNASIQNVFGKIGKAAPPGKYEKGILQCFEKAVQAQKLEEERVQIDETVEHKDLVAGSAAVATFALPKLRDGTPDLSSCVPFKETRWKPLDAFYGSWLDCCFTCGSCGASDTFLFCVDCGEAFHSFCVSAPIHSMDASSVSGWRCPNCKICEISGDVPNDETRMLFCEMCDRGFSLDLVDPPLVSAPIGLWICGQCVDCKVCGNTSEKDGVSVKYWSQDPELCYRCGGCDGYDEELTANMKCQVCTERLRVSDEDILSCHKCDSKVHVLCDERAQEFLTRESLVSRSQKAQKISSDEYLCPACYQPSKTEIEIMLNIDFRQLFSDQARQLILDGSFGQPEHISVEELHQQFIEQIDWETKMQWKDEYLAIIRDGINLYRMAQTVGDPRFVIQQVLQRMNQLPEWLGHRAFRFAVLVKRRHWDTLGFSSSRADVVVLTAKLAASFIDIVSRTLGIVKERDLSFSNRLLDLVKAPDVNGNFSCPCDSVKRSSTTVPFDKVGINLEINEQGKRVAIDLSLALKSISKDSTLSSSYKIASPLCGWGSEVRAPSGITDWKDPRECCLCHICGDDDSGIQNDPTVTYLSGLGRLLPMADGYWVHTSCALWSSEVWEAADDGLIHAVEKARARGAQLKCFGCGFPGATVGCNKGNCPFNYHLPCARACGAVFTSSQQVFCSSHQSCALETLAIENSEPMKTLMIAPDKKSVTDKDVSDGAEADLFTRVGTLLVHSLGSIEMGADGFHSENYITPPGFVSSRIFWSALYPRSRTVYILKIERNGEGQPEFAVIPGDSPTLRIVGSSATVAYSTLIEKVRKVNACYFSQGDMYSKLPVTRRTRRKAYGLNGPQFFGFGLNTIRRLLESSPGVEAVVAPLCSTSPQYRFCFTYGPGGNDPSTLENMIRDIQRKRAAAKAEQAAYSSTGCARTEGIKAVVRSGGSGRITRALVRSAEDDTSTAVSKKGDEKVVAADRSLVQSKYRKMKSIPIENRLVARRSHIHGWGLFTKLDIPKNDPVAEYMGEIIRQRIADKREKAYELSGEGSCFMFRLDMNRIIDATQIGCMARFMNHSCQPNAYAKILSIDTDLGQERKIVVFALRDIAAGEEVTYDYKFPVEDGSLRCSCGAPNCIGRLN